jgi:hypothetical protein
MSIFYVWIQEELPNRLYNINQQDTETLEDTDDVGKMTSETEQDDDDDDDECRCCVIQ